LIPGEAAFYGPKIDVKLIDAIGRAWQLSTVQFDFNLPKKFELEYVASDGQRKRPLMVHRALYGSIERFFGILIEHYCGAFPLWLAPVQVKVLTITEGQLEAGQALVASLRSAGLRADLDSRHEKVGAKIRDATLEKVPYMAILGPKDIAAGTVALRLRDGRQVPGIAPEELIAKLLKEAREKLLAPVFAS
ncbi:MAG: threonine--tRNA ligase, partial [Elusimicrobia bacterium]|nr:threonine--tRNA ligase [Elusimicrobiota bacterium]